MIDLAVIIVTWNVRELALDALQSLYADLESSHLSYTIYVVDNASSDGTASAIADRFPQVRLTASETNLGFGGGNNLALRQIGFGSDEQTMLLANLNPRPPDPLSAGAGSGRTTLKQVGPPLAKDSSPKVRQTDLPRAVYLLNADTITRLGATGALFDVLMSAADVGLVGAQLEFADGSFQHGAFAFPGLRQLWVELFPTPGRFIEGQFNGRYSKTLYQQNAPFPVDFTLGATMMLRREVIEQTGMFDEGFFMYCEEIDWAWRIHKAGWRVLTVPAARVVHLSGQSTSQVRAQSVIHLWTSRLRLFEKHYPLWKYWLAKRLVRLGMGRKIRLAEHDPELDGSIRTELIAAYKRIQAAARS